MTRVTLRSVLLVCLLMCVAVLPGCFIVDTSVGKPLSPDYKRLVVDVTTKAEALDIVGAPDSARRQSDGDIYFYNRTHDYSSRLQLIPFITVYERTDGQISTDRLALIFDTQGILRGIGLEKEIPVDEDDEDDD
jgi:hypothetical protein